MAGPDADRAHRLPPAGGLAAGIGFIGVGVGLGRWGPSVIGVLLTLLILTLVGRFTGHKDNGGKQA